MSDCDASVSGFRIFVAALKCLVTLIFPACMECQRGLATSKLSVRLLVWQTRALWQNRRKICQYFKYITYNNFVDHLA